MIKFKENGIIKNKRYFINFIIKGDKHQLISIIIHDKYIFL